MQVTAASASKAGGAKATVREMTVADTKALDAARRNAKSGQDVDGGRVITMVPWSGEL
jgi:hypothetical protein